MDGRKRNLSGDEEPEKKRPRYNVYVRLESESSNSTDNDTESIYSIQDKETDVARDTSDTDIKSERSSGGLEVELEYEVASLSGDEDFPFGDDYSSSGTEDLHAVEGAIAAVLCETSFEAWATDGETSDSSIDGGVGGHGLTDFWTCVQCKSQDKNRLFRYCEKCFQVRKNLFPPRPRGTRKRKLHKQEPPVKLDRLQSCLSRSTQDTGTRTTLSQDYDFSNNNFAEQKQLCIMCNSGPKNGIFLHGNIGHCCCCYKCAMKCWKTNKRCPICNCKDVP